MRRALEYSRIVDGVIAQHAEEPRLTRGAQLHEGAVAAELGLAGWPAVAEEAIIARDVLLAAETGARLHICHVSTAGSVELIRWAKARGVRVTAEVTPHHLFLTDESARGYDARFKVNPPLRTGEDVAVLRAALADGTLDVVATDHAPHPAEAKRSEWQSAANGMVGLETAASVVQAALVETGLLGWADVERVMSSRPAEIGSLTPRTLLAAGASADLTLIDPAASREFGIGDLAGRSTNSPYLGMRLPGRVVATVFRGRPTVLDGRLVAADEVHGDER
jgi:dihydroorotase